MENDKKGTATKWSRQDEAILVHTLTLEKLSGNWRGNNPGKGAWIACNAALAGSDEKSGGAPKNITTIKNRWQRLKKEFKIVKDIRNQPGWGWSHERHIVRVSFGRWRDYVAKNPRAKPFFKKEFPLYEKIAELVDGAHTAGNNASLEPQICALTPVSLAPSIDPSFQEEKAKKVSKSDDESDPESNIASYTDEDTETEIYQSVDYANSRGDESIEKRTQRKRSNGTVLAGNEQRKSRRISVSEALTNLVNVMEGMAGIITQSASMLCPTASQPHIDVKVLAAAVSTIARDEHLSDAELTDVVLAVINQPQIAEAYLALKQPGNRTFFIRRRIEEYRKSK